MLRLKALSAGGLNKASTLDYELRHITPGPDGTHLRLNVRVTINPDDTTAAELVGVCPTVEGEDPEKALDKLADWLDRASKAIRGRTLGGQCLDIKFYQGGL